MDSNLVSSLFLYDYHWFETVVSNKESCQSQISRGIKATLSLTPISKVKCLQTPFSHLSSVNKIIMMPF